MTETWKMRNSEFHKAPYWLIGMIAETNALRRENARMAEETRLIREETEKLREEETRLIEEEIRLIEEETKRITESTEEIKSLSKNDAFISTIKELENVTGKTQAEILKESLNLYYRAVLNS